MRTTLTLDPDVALKIKLLLSEDGEATLEGIINQALRVGLEAPARRQPPVYRVETHALGLRPGLDVDHVNALLDDLQVEEALVSTEKGNVAR